MEQSPSWETNRFSASQGIPRILWNPKVHYRFYRCRYMSQSWARSIQSMPTHPTSWIYILKLSFNLRLGLPSGLFPSGFPTKTLYKPHLFPIRATLPHPSHSSLFGHTNNFWTLDNTLWRTRFGRGCGSVVRQTADRMNEWMNEPKHGN